ncbi:IS66 Orf2 like protein [Photorhabdus aegyptia]|uniref:IS66 Orf2 like protein n=1 Tax=Photorhabdus aegyptia TaxID=2805098 RepID=A0A022PPS8_9GAMM|nr:IS66 Orf2 like protein [Photorhabdus aegyptia]
MRRGIDALTQHLEGLNLRWQDEAAFVFCNKARSRLKVLRWDRHGVWLCIRRLHADTDSRCWKPSCHACISRKLPGGPPQTDSLIPTTLPCEDIWLALETAPYFYYQRTVDIFSISAPETVMLIYSRRDT